MRQHLTYMTRGLLLLALGLVSACSSFGFTKGEKESAAAPAQPTTQSEDAAVTASADGQTLGALTDTQLPDRSCGMILWTLDANRPSPVFRFVSGKEAEIVINGETIAFTRTGGNGDSGFGIYQYQEFESQTGLRLEVSSEFGAEFDGGSYLEQGLLKVHAPEGWSIVAPAAGIAGCRS